MAVERKSGSFTFSLMPSRAGVLWRLRKEPGAGKNKKVGVCLGTLRHENMARLLQIRNHTPLRYHSLPKKQVS